MATENNIETLIKFMVYDNYDSWKQILLTCDANLEEFISELSGFIDYRPIREIRLAIEDNLSLNCIKVFADSKFDSKQMEQLRLAFKSDLSIQQVKIFADENISADNMSLFVEAYKNNFTDDQIASLKRVSYHDFRLFHSFYDDILNQKRRSDLRKLLSQNRHPS